MAETAVVDPLQYDADPLDPNFPITFDPFHFPDDVPSNLPLPPGFMSDLDFDGDLDFSIADLLDIPDADGDLPAAADAPSSPAGSDVNGGSGVSSSSSAPGAPGGGSPDRSGNLNLPSPDSADSTSCVPISGDSAAAAAGEGKVKLEDEEGRRGSGLKRKKGGADGDFAATNVNPNGNPNPNPSSHKFRRSGPSENAASSCVFSSGSEEEEKKMARLIRNRESAQLSRQRKKHYVEELEEKVRSMHSTIAELNSKISFVMAENATLRQQLTGGGGTGSCPPHAVYPPPPPVTSMHFPWVPCSSYALRPQGSPVPLVPIPRLRTQQVPSAPKSRKSDSRKGEGKTKKVASLSLLGLLFCMLFVGVFVPGSKLRYDGNGDLVWREQSVSDGRFVGHSQGRVLAVRGNLTRTNPTEECGARSEKMNVGRGDYGSGLTRPVVERQEHGSHNGPGLTAGNASKPLFASLYVPRNDKLVKIDGNLIIHSVLASEKAKVHLASGAKSEDAPHNADKEGKETSLAISRNLAPALAISKSGRDVERRAHLYRTIAEHQRALAYGSEDKYRDNSKSTPADGPVKEWFREGLEGPVLSSGMCTEVFQFDISTANSGGIIPATSIANNTDQCNTNSSHPGEMKNRRALHSQAIPLPGTTVNKTDGGFRNPPEASSLHVNKSSSSVVVSVLVDPREAGDGDGEGVIAPKSVSRIFVVVLLDSVKYVTYSCALPFKSSAPHL